MNIKYFAVIYLKNGNTDLSKPLDTIEEAVALLKETIKGKEDKVKATTISKRNMDLFKDDMLFGCPAKYNLVKGG